MNYKKTTKSKSVIKALLVVLYASKRQYGSSKG